MTPNSNVSVRYLGTGEAFDERRGNTSIVYDGPKRILLDCGYAVPHRVWADDPDPDRFDAVYLSHFHADHCFGLPALLARMGEDGRTRPLTLIGGPGSASRVTQVLELGYPGMLRKAPFEIRTLQVDPREPAHFGPLTIGVARSWHSYPNHSVRIDASVAAGTSAERMVSVCYSGDGGASAETEALYTGADLLIHEAYHLEPRTKRSHASVREVLAMAARASVGTVHLLHLARSLAGSSELPEAHYPNPGDHLDL